MERIARFSRIMRKVFLALLVLLPVIAALFWTFAEEMMAMGMFNQQGFRLEDLHVQLPLGGLVKSLGFAVSLIPTSVSMYIAWCLARLFGLYSQGLIFTADNVALIRRVGVAMLVGQALSPVQQALLALVLTINNPPGQHMIAFGLGSANVVEVVTGVVIIIVAWVMDEGRKLREEQELVV